MTLSYSSKTKKLIASEHQEQCALFEFAELRANQIEEWKYLYHIPNGELRHKAVAVKLKAAGVKKGIPDTFLSVARKGFHGLYVEMKRADGDTSPEQDQWILALRLQGYQVSVAYSWVEAARVIASYLGDKEAIKQLEGK